LVHDPEGIVIKPLRTNKNRATNTYKGANLTLKSSFLAQKTKITKRTHFKNRFRPIEP
jgi:hypothetical protein